MPFCVAKCRYCSFYSVPVDGRDTGRLIRAILEELDRYSIEGGVDTVYIGGGSPNCLGRDGLLRLIEGIFGRVGRPDEFTIETNPAGLSPELMAELLALGVDRLSIGAQSFDDRQLEMLGRPHNAAAITSTVENARKAGFKNVGLDMIFAIPGSLEKSWKESLERAISLGPEHISAYSIMYEEGTELYEKLQAGRIKPIDEKTDRAMYQWAIDYLAAAGIAQYEMSNFARAGFECRHNQIYWQNGPFIGLGPSAASYWQGRRTANIADIDGYIDALEEGFEPIEACEIPNRLEIACQTAVLMLRQTAGISLDAFRRRSGYDLLELFAEPIARYNDDGLLETTDSGSIRLTRQAMPIADSILCDFAAV